MSEEWGIGAGPIIVFGSERIAITNKKAAGGTLPSTLNILIHADGDQKEGGRTNRNGGQERTVIDLFLCQVFS
jgi:hypothetical protein